jgi:hypothetical protein
VLQKALAPHRLVGEQITLPLSAEPVVAAGVVAVDDAALLLDETARLIASASATHTTTAAEPRATRVFFFCLTVRATIFLSVYEAVHQSNKKKK